MDSSANISPAQGIETIRLSKRSYNCLKRAGIDTIAQLTSLTLDQVSAIPNLGPRSLADIQASLAEHSLSFAKEPSCHHDLSPTTHRPSVLDNDKASVDHFIEELSLSIRTYNCLVRAGIYTVEALLAMSLDEVATIRNIGPKSLAEIQEKLQVYLSANPTLATKVPKTSARGEPPSGTPLSELDISWGLQEELRAAGIRSIEEMVAYSEEELLLQLDIIGYYNVLILKQGLSQRGLALATKPLLQPLVESNTLTALHERDVPLSEISIARLALPEAWEETLMRTGFGDVQELATASEHVLEVACFPWRPDRVSKIKSRLDQYLSWLLQQDSWESEVSGQSISPLYLMALSETTLAEIINRFLGYLDERERTVVEMRYGFDGRRACTLEEVGEVLGLTRERVRQLQNKTLKHLISPKSRQYIRSIAVLIENTFVQAGGVLNENQLCERCNAVLVNGGVDTLGSIRLILDCDSRFQRVKGTRIWGLAGYPLKLVFHICAGLEGLLKADCAPLSLVELLHLLKNTKLSRDDGAQWPTGFVEACLRADPNIEISDDGLCTLASSSSMRLGKVILAMRRIGCPVHFTDIAKAVNELLPLDKQLSTQYTYNILSEHDLFVRVGRGIFGLAEWGLPSDSCLADAAHRVLTEANKPLHINVLTDKVLETWKAQRMSVFAAVENDERFCKVGYQTYWLKERIMQGEPREGTSFSDTFGRYLKAAQDRSDAWDRGREYDTSDEVEKLRRIGTDLFSSDE